MISAGLLLTSGLIPIVAYSEVYLSETQALKIIFPSEELKQKIYELTPNEVKKIEESSKEKVRNSKIRLWVGPTGNTVFIDQVLGKHEFITFAVGVSKDKKVSGVEILEYRETYGQQVRSLEWRKQFIGKTAAAPLKLKDDIVNISGATLSSSHVTSGVRRIIQTYEVIQNRL